MQTLFLTLQLALVGMGVAQLVRSLPGVDRAQGWLEGTWTHGKPLSCWVCLVGWCSLPFAVLSWAAQGQPMGWELLCLPMAWLGAIGAGGAVLQLVKPIVPVRNAPPPLGLLDEE